MSKPFITVFNNKQMAESAYRTLTEYGYHANLIFSKEEMDKFSELNTINFGGLSLSYLTDNDYLLHKLNQGAAVLLLQPDEENWIAAQEIVQSFNGEIVEDERFINYYEQQYDIGLRDEEKHEVGTLGYPYDMLADNAYIDPNIGIGNYDLLEPAFKPEDNEIQH